MPSQRLFLCRVNKVSGLFDLAVVCRDSEAGIKTPRARTPDPHRYGMDGRSWIGRHGFWPLALLWLPAGIVAQAAMRFGASAVGFTGSGEALAAAVSLAVAAPCGLPLAMACRRLWRLGYRRTTWWAGTGLGTLTVAVSVFAGLLGPVAIAACAVLLSLPVWIAWRWLARHG